MSGDPSDPQDLARRFLDLWQEQVAASVADPAMARWLAGFLALTPNAGINTTTGNPGTSPDGNPFADIFAAMAKSTAPGAPAAASASGAGDDRVDELARRLADCESRLAALESGLGGTGEKSRKRPRKR